MIILITIIMVLLSHFLKIAPNKVLRCKQALATVDV